MGLCEVGVAALLCCVCVGPVLGFARNLRQFDTDADTVHLFDRGGRGPEARPWPCMMAATLSG